MAIQTMKIEVSAGRGSTKVAKVALADFVVFSVVIALSNLITGTSAFATAFAFGFLLGAGNIYWLLRISRKVTRVRNERALRYAALNYYARFILTIAVFAVVIIFGIFNPWQSLAGFIASTMTTMVMMIILGKEGIKDAS